ncbi:MAG: hypothetical protein ACE5IW_10530 [bacterium]
MRLKNAPLVEKELVLIYIEDKPAFYARVEEITPDVKPKWWRVKFLVLTLPLKLLTWIIDDEQIRGTEFTMSGTSVRIEKVIPPEETEQPAENVEKDRAKETVVQRKARVLSLHDIKHKK